MGITVNLNEGLLRKARKLAIETNRTLEAVVVDALRSYLAPTPKSSLTRAVKLPTIDGRIMPGVSLDCFGELLEFDDESDFSPRPEESA